MTDPTGHEADRWLPFVRAFVEAYEQGSRLTADLPPTSTGLGEDATPAPVFQDAAPLVLLCSPHPDDEMLTGGLPLRLQQEAGAKVVNLALTLGSAPERQAARWTELQAACRVAGFGCTRFTPPTGFALKDGPEGSAWPEAVACLVALLAELRPEMVFLPHSEDHHPAHVMSHRLVAASLAAFTTACRQTVTAVETEYWRPMAAPNLLVGLNPQDVARLLAAIACHRGEISRNPYHLTLPARLLDNVRRGAELVTGPAGDHPGFLFGELYRVSIWRHGVQELPTLPDGWLAPEQPLSASQVNHNGGAPHLDFVRF